MRLIVQQSAWSLLSWAVWAPTRVPSILYILASSLEPRPLLLKIVLSNGGLILLPMRIKDTKLGIPYVGGVSLPLGQWDASNITTYLLLD